jgi:hypothetical protein
VIENASTDFQLAVARGGSQRYRYALHVLTQAPGGGAFTRVDVGDLHVLERPTLRIDGSSPMMRSMTLLVATAPKLMAQSSTPGVFTENTTVGPYGEPDTVLLPGDPKDISALMTKGAFVRVYAQVRDEAGTWLEQRIATLTVSSFDYTWGDGAVSLQLDDFMVALERSPFPGVWAPVTGSTPMNYATAFQAILDDGFPPGMLTTIGAGNTWGMGILLQPGGPSGIGINVTEPGLSFSGSRVDAISDLAATVNAAFRNTEDGTFTVVTTRDMGDPLGYGSKFEVINDARRGVMVDYQTTPQEDGGFNAVQIGWASQTGDTFGTVFLVDSDTTSPTYYNGPYGRRIRPLEQANAVSSEAEAIDLATTRLNQSKRRLRRATLTIPANPLIQPDDMLELWLHRTDSVTNFLGYGGVGYEEHEVNSIEHTLGEAVMQVETTVTAQ